MTNSKNTSILRRFSPGHRLFHDGVGLFFHPSDSDFCLSELFTASLRRRPIFVGYVSVAEPVNWPSTVRGARVGAFSESATELLAELTCKPHISPFLPLVTDFLTDGTTKFLDTVVAWNVAAPKNPHDLPVRHAHEDQWPGVKEDQFHDGERYLAVLVPGSVALREQDGLDLDVRRRDGVQHDEVRYICVNGVEGRSSNEAGKESATLPTGSSSELPLNWPPIIHRSLSG